MYVMPNGGAIYLLRKVLASYMASADGRRGRPADGRRRRSSVARVSSAAPKKKSFDRGGPVWPPRSNVTNDRLGGGLGGLCPPSLTWGGLGGALPPQLDLSSFFFDVKRRILTLILHKY